MPRGVEPYAAFGIKGAVAERFFIAKGGKIKERAECRQTFTLALRTECRRQSPRKPQPAAQIEVAGPAADAAV